MKKKSIVITITIFLIGIILCFSLCSVFFNKKQSVKNTAQKIPKIIHYCWFGPKPMGPLEKKCIDSWKKNMPDYKIMEWNDSHLNLVNIPYVNEAYKQGKFAFVADVFRLYALKKYGGIYMDTDTEVLKNFDELLNNVDFFCEFENYKGETNFALTPLGAIPNHHIITDLYQSYHDSTYDYDLSPSINEHFRDYIQYKYQLWEDLNGKKMLEIEPGAKIFPYNYFINYKRGVSYAVHHYRASWRDDIKAIITKKYSVIGISFWEYKRRNEMNDEIIWNRKEKILYTIPISPNKYIIIAK